MPKLFKISLVAGLLILSLFIFNKTAEASYSFKAIPGATGASITITNSSGSDEDAFRIVTLDGKIIAFTSDSFVFSVADQEYTFTVPNGTLVPEREYLVQVDSAFGSFLEGSFMTTKYLGSDCTDMKFRCVWETQPASVSSPINGTVTVTLSLGQVNIESGTDIWIRAYLLNQNGYHESAKISVTSETFTATISGVPASGETYSFKILDSELYTVYSIIEDIYVPKTVVEVDLGGSDLTPQYCLDHPDEYCLLEPIPQFGASVDTNDLQGYFTKIISLILMLGSAFAVLMIVYGGVLYMGSESVFKKGEGLAKVEGAIMGLLLLIGSYTILNSINPDLVNLKIRLKPVEYVISEAGVKPDSPAVTGQAGYSTSFKMKGTFTSPSPSDAELTSLIALLKNGTKLKQIVAYTGNKRICFFADNAANTDACVSMNYGEGGVANDEKSILAHQTPKGTFALTSDLRKSSNINDPVFTVSKTPPVNLGASFWMININGGTSGIGIHGNFNNTLDETYGCLRMYNDDLVLLQPYVFSGLPVIIK